MENDRRRAGRSDWAVNGLPKS
ncbi:hypothetical protein AVEN_251367-1, partial [Araneus ventricosus]